MPQEDLPQKPTVTKHNHTFHLSMTSDHEIANTSYNNNVLYE